MDTHLIDFDRIINENSTSFIEEFGQYRSYREEDVKKMLRAVCNQVLDEAAKRAEADIHILDGEAFVKKNSILSIKDEL